MPTNQIPLQRELLSPPGDTILETIEFIKMSQAELADRLGKTPSKVHDLITGKEPVTYNTALQLEKVLGIDAGFWMNREMNYRTKLARIEQDETMQQSTTWLAQQPVNELKKCGYITTDKKEPSLVAEALAFYGVASVDRWQSRYINEFASASYRKSTVHEATLGSMAAWLRIGEVEMQKMQLGVYDKDAFKNVLEQIKTLIATHPDNFAEQLQQQCATAGVAVVFTMCLPKAPVNGAARWFRSNPLIQLTDRFKTNDHFWFTFYHEAAHILLHNKKDMFLEDFEGYEPDEDKEAEADRFASRNLLPSNFNDDLPFRIIEADITELATKYETHPGIIVGRLQHLGLIKHSFGNKYKTKVELFK